MSEIKKGDKVRVSKDAPKLYVKGWLHDWCKTDSIVKEMDNEDAVIAPINRPNNGLAIPCKYLVKVDAEVGVGDRVIVHYPNGDRIGCIQEVMLDGTYDIDYGNGCTGHNITRSQIEPYVAPKIKIRDRVRCKTLLRLANSTDNDFIGIVTDAVTYGENGWFSVRMDNGAIFQTYHESDLELIEPAEQTHQRATIISEGDTALIEPTLLVGSIKIPVEVDLTDSYWGVYTADLAKEIALKVANKFNTPEEVACYAVKVAKEVADGLKKK